MPATETKPEPLTADRLNSHLTAGGIVQVSTYLKSTIYTRKHAGWFTENAKGEIFVRQGRGKVCIAGIGGRFVVGIRLGRWVNA